jgi:hypothetical protein
MTMISTTNAAGAVVLAENEARRWPVAAEARVGGVILPTVDMTILAIFVAMVRNSRLSGRR